MAAVFLIFFTISSFVFNREKKFKPVWSGWVKDDRISIFRWTVPLKDKKYEYFKTFIQQDEKSFQKNEMWKIICVNIAYKTQTSKLAHVH